jgi:hypothetical protein
MHHTLGISQAQAQLREMVADYKSGKMSKNRRTWLRARIREMIEYISELEESLSGPLPMFDFDPSDAFIDKHQESYRDSPTLDLSGYRKPGEPI